MTGRAGWLKERNRSVAVSEVDSSSSRDREAVVYNHLCVSGRCVI